MASGQSSRTRGSRGSGVDDLALDPALPFKKRARHRLIGAMASCALVIAVLPWIFEAEPVRPQAELAILAPMEGAGGMGSAGSGQSSEAGQLTGVAPSSWPAAAAEAVGSTAAGSPAAVPSEASGPGPSAATLTPPEGSQAPRAPSGPSGSSSAQTSSQLPSQTSSPKPAPGASVSRPAQPPAVAAAAPSSAAIARQGRYVVQVGAFATDNAARQALDRIQATGLAGFTERIRTERGDRIRVRAGPFDSREAADRARQRLNAAGMDAAIIAP